MNEGGGSDGPSCSRHNERMYPIDTAGEPTMEPIGMWQCRRCQEEFVRAVDASHGR